MKKFKNYILMLLVPLILLGCVSKGVADAVEDTTTSNLGGYTWAQLQAMVDGTNLDSASYSSNVTRLNNLVTALNSLDKSTAASKTTNLISYIGSDVYTQILENDSTFVYSSAISNLDDKNNTIIELMSVYNYEKIVAIYETVGKLIANNSTAASDSTLLGYYSSLSSTVSLISKRENANVFYSPLWELYSIYYNVLINGGAKDYLKNIYNIDFAELNQNENITLSMNILNTEISALNTNEEAFSEKTTLVKAMNQLYTTYQNYLSGSVTYSDVTSMRNYLKTTETSVLAGTVGDYSTMIDNVFNRLKAKDVSNNPIGSQEKTEILLQLSSYYLKNDYYDQSNYLIINSKVTNIVSELSYLKSIEDELTVDIGISVDW